MIAQLAGLHKGLNLNEHDVHFSFTPLAHLAERVVLLYALKCGMAIGEWGDGASPITIYLPSDVLFSQSLTHSLSVMDANGGTTTKNEPQVSTKEQWEEASSPAWSS